MKADHELFVIGQGLGPVGRWLRLFLGVYFLVFLVVNPLYLHPLQTYELRRFALSVGAYFLLIATVHFIVFYLISKPILSRLNPWAGTGIFVGIPTALALLGAFPPTVQAAFGLYIGVSLVLLFFMRYGGCEVVAIPSLLLGRRFTMYCPYNAIDAIERAMTPGKDLTRHRLLTIISVAIVIFVGGYFILVDYNDLLGRYDVAFHVDNRWSLLLLIPCTQLATLALKSYRAERTVFAPGVRKYALGGTRPDDRRVSLRGSRSDRRRPLDGCYGRWRTPRALPTRCAPDRTTELSPIPQVTLSMAANAVVKLRGLDSSPLRR